MPIKKVRLSRQEQVRHRVGIEELLDAGVECEFPDELQAKDLDILVGPPAGNMLCQLSSGVMIYAFNVKLIAQRSNVRLEDYCRIVSAWDSESIVLCGCERGLYRVGRTSFPENEVLNHRIENGLTFHCPGEVVEGLLVANGLIPVPSEYPEWMLTTLSLTFTDQFGSDYSVQARAAVERSAVLKNPDSRTRRSRGLYDSGEDLENEIRHQQVQTSTPRKGVEQPQQHGEATAERYHQSIWK